MTEALIFLQRQFAPKCARKAPPLAYCCFMRIALQIQYIFKIDAGLARIYFKRK